MQRLVTDLAKAFVCCLSPLFRALSCAPWNINKNLGQLYFPILIPCRQERCCLVSTSAVHSRNASSWRIIIWFARELLIGLVNTNSSLLSICDLPPSTSYTGKIFQSLRLYPTLPRIGLTLVQTDKTHSTIWRSRLSRIDKLKNTSSELLCSVLMKTYLVSLPNQE